MYTPGHVAAHLQIDASTLRRWARQFRTHLSRAATSGSPRHYTDDDLAILQQIKALLDEGQTVSDIQQQLDSHRAPDGHPAGTLADQAGTRDETGPMGPKDEQAGTQVLLLDEHRPELEALRRLIEQQRQLLDQQERHIIDQATLLDQHQQMLESHEREIERARADGDKERANTERVQSELDRARTEHAQLLADVRAMLARMPRWAKRWWGLS